MPTPAPIKKVLIANRGEIALRVIRALREMGIRSVAVYSEVDREELHVRQADEAYLLGPAAPSESYLRIDRILEVAKQSGADAVHPGYGFLAENADFARAVEDAGLTFIGPTPETIAEAGDKLRARAAMVAAGVPVIPGTQEAIADPKEIAAIAEEIGFPVALKAVGGGGGKGIRIVYKTADLIPAFERASAEALASFGNGAMYVEKFLENPRHIEIQLLSDTHGNHLHLGERECSIQRRHQKLLEEAPSPNVDAAMRARMGEAATTAARAVNYRGAGTVEFLVDKNGDFYFLEINTRIQVEHPVTEMVYGIDLIRWQVRVAEGAKLPFVQEDLQPNGHAIEIRLTAEDPAAGFFPQTGIVRALRMPEGPGIRVDANLYPGQEITLHYDPMIGKIIAHGRDRDHAIERMKRALAEMRLVGLKTCVPLLVRLLDDEKFRSGDTDTGYLERYVKESDWQSRPVLNDFPADLPAIITAVLVTHERQGAGGAVVGSASTGARGSVSGGRVSGDGVSGGRVSGGSAWLEAGRREAIR